MPSTYYTFWSLKNLMRNTEFILKSPTFDRLSYPARLAQCETLLTLLQEETHVRSLEPFSQSEKQKSPFALHLIELQARIIYCNIKEIPFAISPSSG